MKSETETNDQSIKNNEDRARALYTLFRKVGAMKRVQRAGWVQRGITEAESIAEHCHRVAVMALFLGESLDVQKAITTALLHDLCEVITGDITPADRVDPQVKSKLELDAMREILKDVDPDDTLLNLWLDFELGRSSEGRLIRELDKLEMVLQALEYKEQGYNELDAFFTNAKQWFQSDAVCSVFSVIEEQLNRG